MMRLEYDDQRRFVVPFRMCGKRVVTNARAETYCTYRDGHDPPCEPPAVKSQTAVKPIPCSCIDCKAKREGIIR